jgi:hypothetical protein
MKRRDCVLIGGLFITIIAGPALADPPTQIVVPSNSVVVHTMDGKTTVATISARRQAQLLASEHTHELGAGIVVMVVDGRTYLVEDHIMPNGEPMVASILRDFEPQEGGG